MWGITTSVKENKRTIISVQVWIEHDKEGTCGDILTLVVTQKSQCTGLG